jgi:hypothetical protein
MQSQSEFVPKLTSLPRRSEEFIIVQQEMTERPI